MKYITKNHLGRMLYPMDNSYAEPSRAYLAGAFGQEARLVKIISEPYQREVVGALGRPSVQEMIDVEYQGQKHTILNTFSETQPYPFSESFDYFD